MKALELLQSIFKTHDIPKHLHDIEIQNIHHDSREINAGDLFIAFNGTESDGHAFISSAIERGAALILSERELDESISVPYLQIQNPRETIAKLAQAFYMKDRTYPIMVGITGTNGKTTTSIMIHDIFQSSGHSCAQFGTLFYKVNGEQYPSLNSTPDAITLHRYLANCQDDVVIMEISSHGIHQFRTHGLTFDYLIFTNLYHDHLDYHADMEEYFQVKSSLFRQLKPDGYGIIFADQDWGEKLLEQWSDSRFHSIGTHPSADFYGDPDQSSLHHKNGVISFNVTVPGTHNFLNASMAAAASYLAGLPTHVIEDTLSNHVHVPGRFEQFNHPENAKVVVDYAHTEDAFYHLLSTAKQAGANSIYHVFGFRGNRDLSKRKGMLQTSALYADHYILTSDDFNNVSPEDMHEQLNVIQSLHGQQNGTIIFDRTEAIYYAWNLLKEGDWLLITGKGHENYQQHYMYPADSDIEWVKALIDSTPQSPLQNQS
ncbi:UDP-N-acetylmuramoyl-L-alanyl-D-glutamate--2,6-diaminopimelate ligase [Thalassobacillus sp. CUG 92003]|uniref:UDP-N-acetylmuramoyl-L-alanyl-D-glutamate--2, 6-diaminopimelate ligase n=1 Tax=Thalassobacillus sp. CUG 92003 TaxID=2736641 RepID=UPI0015E69EDE